MTRGLNFPKEFLSRYQKIIPEFDKFVEILKVPLIPSLRINTLKAPKEKIFAELSSLDLEPIPWCNDGYYVKNQLNLGSLEIHKQGLIYLQEATSMLPSIILDPKPQEKILDLAAAPGSKTTHIAMLMRNQGLIVANDISKLRLKALISNLKRLGVINTVVTNYPGQVIGTLLPNYFDKILLDAPCSLEGTIRNSPEVIKNWKESKIKRLSNLQCGLINSAFKALKPNGILVYSTCTFAPEENESVVSYLLKKYPYNAICEPIVLSHIKYHSGITSWNSKIYPDAVKNCIRIYPHDNNTEGFFIAKIKKVTNDMDLLSHINKKRTVKTSIKNINNLLSELANKYDFLSKILQQYAVECKNQILYIMTNEAKEFEALKIIYRGFPWAKLVRNKIFITDNSLAILRNLSFNGENV